MTDKYFHSMTIASLCAVFALAFGQEYLSTHRQEHRAPTVARVYLTNWQPVAPGLLGAFGEDTPFGGLRSAFLLRAASDSASHLISEPEHYKRQLQHHFDIVYEMLKRQSARSLSIALQRL